MKYSIETNTSDGRFIVGIPARCLDGFRICVTDTVKNVSWTQYECATMEGTLGAQAEILASYQPGGRARS